MTFEEQLELVHQVMMDRSIPSRPGPRKQRLRELGLPDDAPITTLLNHWRYRRSNEVYHKPQPRW